MFNTRPKHIIFIYALLNTVTLAGLWSCRKDVENFRPYPSTLEAIQQLLDQVPSATSHATFVLSGTVPDTALITPGGVRVFLTDNEHLFSDTDGNPVPCSTCQTLRVEVTEALRKGDIIARGIHTVSTDGSLLESGGMLRVNVSCDGKALQLLPDRKLKIQVPADDPADDMFVFEGIMKSDTFGSWADTGLPVFQSDWLAPNQVDVITGYELFSPHLNWINCDRFVGEPTTSFCVDLPPEFNPENSRVYLVFENMQSIAPLETDLSSGTFCYPMAPHGFQVRIVSISKTEDGRYWLGNKQTEIGTNATVEVQPQEVQEQQVLNFLKNL
ncbi:MAG: hypothetical protein R2791_09175 [Saprospiraceae bacterium]